MVDAEMSSLAFVFPGQGSQKVGMGKAWAEAFEVARDTFAEADAVLGFSLSRLCWEGPAESLQLTANTQPAILATSVAAYRVVRANGLRPGLVAGHSLGEYSALVAAGSLAFDDALQLVRQRGELMQEAVPEGVGGMAAIMGLDADAVAAVAADAAADEVCSVANLNAPVQTVIAGHRAAVERATVLAKERGAKRAIVLPVSAPFHSPLMAPARHGLAPLLAATEFLDPRVPVVTNVDARPVEEGGAARDALERQVDGPVRWVESIGWMAEEGAVRRFVEIGPGSVLSGLIRRIAPGAVATSLTEPAKLEELLTEMGVG